jgi:GrpB-like predicted nucleotidyltransferase (UPF0157 family)
MPFFGQQFERLINIGSLQFREILRANSAVREAYAREKLRVAEMVGWDKAAYSLAKGPFIESILERELRSTRSAVCPTGI